MSAKHLLLISSLIVLLAATTLTAGTGSGPSPTLHRYVVHLQDTFDHEALTQELAGLDRFAARRLVVERYTASRAAAAEPYLAVIRPHLWTREARDITSPWIAPVIFLACTEELSRTLRAMPGVTAVFEDTPQPMIPTPQPNEPEPLLRDPMTVTYNINAINANDVWALGYTGVGVLVGGFDTGIRTTHVELVNRMWRNPREAPIPNGVDDDGNGYIDDIYGFNFISGTGDITDSDGSFHGTHTAGTIVSDGAEGQTCGVAPGAKIMGIKIIGSDGSGTVTAFVNGVAYGVFMGLDVMNCSVGWSDPSAEVKNIMRQTFQPVYDAGIIAAVSAGNGDGCGGHCAPPQDINSPADIPAPWYGSAGHGPVLAIGSTNASDNVSSFSSRGPTSWNTVTYTDYPHPPGLKKPDVAAPGSSISSTFGGDDYGHQTLSGTSMAAPCAAGAIALLLSKNPLMTIRQIDSLLETTAHDIAPTGRDSSSGAGRIDVLAAANATPEVTVPIIRYLYNTIAGDGIIDAGETVTLTATLHNYGANATSVNGTLTEYSPYVTAPDPIGAYGTINRGADATNTTNTYSLAASAGAPPIFGIPCTLHVTGSPSYSSYDGFNITAGLRNRLSADHTNGVISYTVTNFGSGGFYDPQAATPGGIGFLYNGYNYLYSAQLFVSAYANQVYTGEGGASSEFKPASLLPIASPGAHGSEQEGTATYAYVDPATGNPIVGVSQSSYVFSTAGQTKFVIIQYRVKNWSGATLPSVYVGQYCDWDIDFNATSRVWYDRGVWSPSQRWGYMYDNAAPATHPAYVGIVGLRDESRGSIINNQAYVYAAPGLGWTDTVKYNFLNGSYFATLGDTNGDWSMMSCIGPMALPNGVTWPVAFALVCGDNLTEFETNAAQAITTYQATLALGFEPDPAQDLGAERMIVLPSPSSGAVSLRWVGPWSTRLSRDLVVADLLGRTVTMLQPMGEFTWRWDPQGKATPGVYLLKSAEGRVRGRVVIE